ncbi:ATP-dependent DNA helicase RecG [Candidatus Daviesbacteria bacterium]|nr:ATP-dependent DNA helicase RecG [Candidatus Daviesbacteria bacterium]
MDLKTPLYQLTGIGSSLAYKLKRLNLNTIEDLIYHFPFRYDDFSHTTSVVEAKVGETVTLQGEVWSIKNIYTRSRKILTQAIFNDGTSPIELTWFNQPYLTKQIKVGDRLQVSGKLGKYKNKLSIMMPKWEEFENLSSHSSSSPREAGGNTDQKGLHTGGLIPVYPETEGLTSKWIRAKIDALLPLVQPSIKDPLPETIKGRMLDLNSALAKIHYPDSWEDAEKARERLGFDELFFVSLATQKARMEWDKKPVVKPLTVNKNALNNFIKKLPFELTSAQKKVLKEVLSDLEKTQPMNRLMQGEVGSGKTVVAAIIIYLLHLNKLKTLFMAPTEILAFQHFETISKLLGPFGIKVGIYTGSKKRVSNDDVVIGTHALLSDKLNIQEVGLVIVDEQQRFGVEQRTILRNRAKVPHFLTMTATPIPRTVALTLYGDLDLSIIDEMPKGRPLIKTYLVPEKKRQDSYKFIEQKINEGDQAYIITPLIEPSETLQTVRAAKEEYEKLTKIFPKLKLGLLHGRLKSKDKEGVMADFKSGAIHILVATSVVEVGMDVPNATIMVVEGAERFGLAQLHQLRGRIGRGSKTSYCLLYTSSGSSSSERSRLKYLENTFDGLKLAELDLKIRGSGEIFGIKQSGRFEFKIASFSNLTLVEKTKTATQRILQDNPSLDKYPLLRRKLQELAASVMPD